MNEIKQELLDKVSGGEITHELSQDERDEIQRQIDNLQYLLNNNGYKDYLEQLAIIEEITRLTRLLVNGEEQDNPIQNNE